MNSADPQDRRSITVLGTVMKVEREGNWVIHQVEATDRDGRRFTLEVVSKQRHTGSVRVRWDPSETAEPRFLATRDWGLYLVVAAVIVAVVVAAWIIIG